MSDVPSDLKYTKSHEWIRVNPDGTVLVGITDHAQEALGDLVFVELPTAGTAVKRGEACAVVESVKAASDVYSPLTGEVMEGNAELENAPEKVNEDPYGAGWLMKIRPASKAEFDGLLDADAYQKVAEAESH